MTARALETEFSAGGQPPEFERLWRGFMTARATLGVVLVLLQAGLYLLNTSATGSPLMICLAYAGAALWLRLTDRPRQLGQTLDALWLRTVGLDVLTFSGLQLVQGGSINYTALLALPVLMVSVLGSPRQAIASAAGVTLLLFGDASWESIRGAGDLATYLPQAALTGAGCFAISFVASQMATRLASVELRAQHSQLVAQVQQQVNQLVIDSLTEGILVVTVSGQIHLANPAAAALLEAGHAVPADLTADPGWSGLWALVRDSFNAQKAQQARIEIRMGTGPLRRLLARTQITSSIERDTQELCVVFLQDQREFEARIRAEKLAGMGRMSAAVAHEIRNPLAAIAQANELLTEDLTDPAQLRLAQLIRQNASRLENIIQDILHLVQVPDCPGAEQWIELDSTLQRMGRDWSMQNQCIDVLWIEPISPGIKVLFDVEHLRRMMTNLLDNALRYTSRQEAGIQLAVLPPQVNGPPQMVRLSVWSDAAALDPSVERHLFEPFFSSESRSSGLGLYICRELCESHGALIGYERNDRQIRGKSVPGNDFFVMFRSHANSQPDRN